MTDDQVERSKDTGRICRVQSREMFLAINLTTVCQMLVDRATGPKKQCMRYHDHHHYPSVSLSQRTITATLVNVRNRSVLEQNAGCLRMVKSCCFSAIRHIIYASVRQVTSRE